MIGNTLYITGGRRRSAFECRVDADSHHLNLTQFEPLLQLCLRRFESEDGWIPSDVLFPASNSPRKYIQRIRIELDGKELVQVKRPRLYRLAFTREQIHLDEELWGQTDVDPLLLQRLRVAYLHFLGDSSAS